MIESHALDVIFRNARTQNGFLPEPIDPQKLHALYELMKWGPTTMNSQPARIVFVVSKDAKEKLRPALMPGNLDKTMAAPATAIVAYDLEFHAKLPRVFPNSPNAKLAFEGKPELIERTALRNSSLQGAYLIIAARALGLDAGPMSGFDNAKVDQAFFPDGKVKSNFLCNLGRGDPAKIFPRNPRLDFAEACRIV